MLSSPHAPFGPEEEGIGAFAKALPSQEEWENGPKTQRMEEHPLAFLLLVAPSARANPGAVLGVYAESCGFVHFSGMGTVGGHDSLSVGTTWRV